MMKVNEKKKWKGREGEERKGRRGWEVKGASNGLKGGEDSDEGK